MFNNLFSETFTVYDVTLNNVVEPDRPHITI